MRGELGAGRRLRLQGVQVVPCAGVHELTGFALGPQPIAVFPLQQPSNDAWFGQVQKLVSPLVSKQQVRLLELLQPTASRPSTMAIRSI
jgi:hypothetical protein